jgi:hypothetical protein
MNQIDRPKSSSISVSEVVNLSSVLLDRVKQPRDSLYEGELSVLKATAKKFGKRKGNVSSERSRTRRR